MKILWSFMMIFALAACQTGSDGSPDTSDIEKGSSTRVAATTTSADGSTDVVDQRVDLIFIDLSGFDSDLSDSLGDKNQKVVINLPAKFSLNDIPERLDIWLSRVKNSGGRVQAAPKPKEGEDQTRGFLGLLIDIVVSTYAAAADERMYRTADDYDVVLVYDAETGEVQNAIFYHR